MSKPRMSYLLEYSVGLAFASAHPAGIVLSVLMPVFVLRQPTRSGAYGAAACYYAGALWPLIPGARNFFGPTVSIMSACALWAVALALLALPWPLVWSVNREQHWWRGAGGLALSAVPPLGIIGWASPLTAAGFLFPGACWLGLAACAIAPGVIAARPRYSAVTVLIVSLICNGVARPLAPPGGWIAVNTRFGGIAHGAANPLAEHEAAQTIQRIAISSQAKVILFPETVVPTWTAATDAFWRPTLESLRSEGKIIIVGARLPTPFDRAPASSFRDVAAALAVLRGERAPTSLDIFVGNESQYDNTMIIRGAETAALPQRIPVPIAMWKPFEGRGAGIHLLDPGVFTIRHRRAAALICYEQLLVWPAVTSMARRPEIILAAANDYWAAGTPIMLHQHLAVNSWSRLFAVPYLFAANL